MEREPKISPYKELLDGIAEGDPKTFGRLALAAIRLWETGELTLQDLQSALLEGGEKYNKRISAVERSYFPILGLKYSASVGVFGKFIPGMDKPFLSLEQDPLEPIEFIDTRKRIKEEIDK